MDCSRCQFELREVEGTLRWSRLFVCDDCDSAWRFEGSMLVRGRSDNPGYDALRKFGLRETDAADVVLGMAS